MNNQLTNRLFAGFIILLLASFSYLGSLFSSGSDSTKYTAANGMYTVTRVVDGDTIKVSRDGIHDTVRLLGIDTPETVHPEKPVECFGIEASNYAKQLLAGKEVRLETDPSQSLRDRHERLLAYVFVDDTNINEKLVTDGYAYEFTYDQPYEYQKEFKRAEKTAREDEKGLWAKAVCS